jgi:lauroyl/myristoyl acyltransferase
MHENAPGRAGEAGVGAPFASGKDLQILAKLPLSAAVAWCVPERWWDGLAERAARLETGTLRRTAARMAAVVGADRLPAPAGALARRQLALVRLDQLCYLRSYRPGGWRPELRLEGREHLDAALAAGRGAVLWVVPTVGQWLPTKRTMAEAGYAVHHLSHPSHGFSTRSALGRRWLNPIRTGVEDRYLAERVLLGADGGAQAALRRLGTLLRRNAVVSITVGAAGARPIRVPLLRGSLTVASGAPHLAARTGAALLPVLTVREGRGRFLTRIEAPLPMPATGPIDAASLRGTVAELARRLEPCALAHADQIVWGLTCFDPLPAPAIIAAEG